MAVPSSAAQQKTAGDLQLWLRDELSPKIPAPTLAVPHGGTALMLLGLKESSKDVDFSFTSREDFARFLRALGQLGYRATMELEARPDERMVRMENSKRRVDVVDLRWPTWNAWRITRTVLSEALQLPMGKLTAARLDRNAVFLFKTHPLRDTDIVDLRAVLDAAALDEARILSLLDEQDLLHRKEFRGIETRHEPLLKVLELRVRVAGSLDLIGPDYRRRIPRFARRAAAMFRELGLDRSLQDLVDLLRGSEGVVSWDDIVGSRFEELRNRLAATES